MKYLALLLLTTLMCSCDKKGALEDLTDAVLESKQGVYIEITPVKKEEKK